MYNTLAGMSLPDECRMNLQRRCDTTLLVERPLPCECQTVMPGLMIDLRNCGRYAVSALVAVTLASAAVAAEPGTVATPITKAPAAGTPVPLDGPLSADAAVKAFVLEPGLRIELVAAEPLVDSPVAMALDERGRLFVAENRGYPNGPAAGESPVGRISLLKDIDGDGRFDTRTTFADGLTFPNGVMPWGDGLIVTCGRTSSSCATQTATAAPTSAACGSPDSRPREARSYESATRR